MRCCGLILSAAMTAGGVTSSATPHAMTPRRVIALHGKGESRASFQQRLQPLLDRLDESQLQVTFLEAPWELGSGGQWWKLPPGVRSYEAESYDGVERSLELLTSEFALGDVYGVIGFSQGAIFLSFFLAANLQLRRSGKPAMLPRKALLIGSAWPRPYSDVMNALKALPPRELALLGCDSLHVIGNDDSVNPPEQVLPVSACFGDSTIVHTHAGKHIIPVDEDSLAIMSRFLLDGCEEADAMENSGAQAAAPDMRPMQKVV
ncbi:serine hydrolase-domain-containing protein [Pavlovales sp. CCMP2436]|nr:serine hydrolase-domain-containing protein [Pavlovales sp. CCMP2436]